MSRRNSNERQQALQGVRDTRVVGETRARIESLEGRGTGRQKRNHGPRFTIYCEEELVERIDEWKNKMETDFPGGGTWSRSDIVVPLLNAALSMLEEGELNLEPQILPVVSGFSVTR